MPTAQGPWGAGWASSDYEQAENATEQLASLARLFYGHLFVDCPQMTPQAAAHLTGIYMQQLVMLGQQAQARQQGKGSE